MASRAMAKTEYRRIGQNSEQAGAGVRRFSLPYSPPPAKTGDDDVDLVARVRLLWVVAARRVDFHGQAAVREHLREARLFAEALREVGREAGGQRIHGAATEGVGGSNGT